MGSNRIRIKTKFPIIDELKKAFTPDKVKQAGDIVIGDMKHHIERGLSPVKGWGRFQGYKAQGAKNKKGYPYNVQDEYPDKKVRPVNLKLSGKMQSAIEARPHPKAPGFTIGIFNKEELKKAETHNEGTNPNVPQRKFIPTAKGEEFTPTIMRTIKEVVRDIVAGIIDKTNKK